MLTNQSNNTTPIEIQTQMSSNWSQIINLQTNQNQIPTSSSSNQLESPKPNTLTDTEIINKCIVNGNLKDEILYSLDWGNIPINQSTPWDLPNQQPSPREIHSSFNGVTNGIIIDNSWKYSTSTIGTEIWETNIRKKSISSDLQLNHQLLNEQQKLTQQIAPNSLNHFGGNWGGDDTTPINTNKLMWNGSNSAINNNNNNNNWSDDNNDKNGWIDDKINTWNSMKDMNGWNNYSESAHAILQENSLDGTALWKRPQPKMNQRSWKEDDLLIKQTNKPNNLTNQCANFNAQNNNNNNNNNNNSNFISTSPSVNRLPQNLNSLQANNKVQNLQLPNWNDLNQNKNQLSNNNNGIQQSNSGGVFWNNNNNNSTNNDTNNAQSNWNKSQQINQDDWNMKKELILQSQQFKVLLEKGFRKESIENALRNSNMNLRDAIEELRADALKENCNDIDKRKNSGFNHTSSLPPNSSINRNTSSQSFNQISQQQTQQPNQIFRNNNNNNNNLNNKTNSNTTMGQDPKRLGNLVQQINLAVQSGHLNAQILNQPLSVNTIQLINQLLAQIRNLQQLQQLQQHAPNMNKNSLGPNSQTADLNVQITVIKQRISNIQNQIRVQQGFYMNSNQQLQQQQQQQTQQSIPNADIISNGLPIGAVQLQNDFTKLISPDSTTPDNLIGDLRDLQIGNNSQSRLSKWQQNAVTNSFDNSNGQSGFSRAPGSINNPTNNNWSSNGNNFNNDDNSWNLNDTTVTNSNELKNVLQNQQTTFLTDQVPEFEPGKPWKSAIKSSDDDPHLTPGSVNRSIVSLNNLNNWSSKNTTTVNNNLQQQTTNTWSFNTNGNASVVSSNSSNWNGGAAINNNFTNESTSPVENLWQQHSNKSKGPPPGLQQQTSSLSPNKSIASSLIIKNITPQVDTSTLKLLCSQHGPLQIFQILSNGFAIVKYKTKEEAIKAQSALNNCQLGNTKIFVDFVAEDSEIQNYLTNQSQLNTANSVYLNGGQAIINNQTTANLWRNNAQQQVQNNNDSQWSFNSNNLWNNSIDTNSTMQNLLPGDLLNGETS